MQENSSNLKIDKKCSWIKNPTLKQVILFTTLSLGGLILLILSMTNLFSEPLFQKNYIMLYPLMLGSIFSTVIVHINYRRSKS